MQLINFKIIDSNSLIQRRLFFSLLLIFLACFNVPLAHGSFLSVALQGVDKYVQQQIKEKNVVGCAVAVVDHGKIIFMKAYGVQKKGETNPINLDTIFQLGSISKPITSTLVATLIKENRLKLGSFVVHFYPGISPRTTLQHLLSHTTGYNRKGWNQKIEASQTRDSLLKQLAASPQASPGSQFDYHNLAYSLIEEVVRTSLQQPFDKVLKVKLFQPIGMTQTTVGDLDFMKQSNVAWPHQKNKKGVLHASKSFSRNYHRTICSAGGMSSNIKDMAAFLQVQLGGRPDILTLQDLEPFHAPVVDAPDALVWLKPEIKGPLKSYYGLGWRIIDANNERIVFHGGWLKGFISFLAFIPDRQIGIVVLNNSEGPFGLRVALNFFNDLNHK